jgi:hypothetical protein
MQYHRPSQVVVTWDPVTDDPAVGELVRSVGATLIPYTRNRALDGTPQRSMPESLNQGVSACTGEYLVTLQPDHIVAPDYLLWLVRCLRPDAVTFGLTDRIADPSPSFLTHLALASHLPDGESRYEDYMEQGRPCLVEFHDWRHTDGLDHALPRDRWIDIDTAFPPSGHMWMDHMLQLYVSGMRFVINPLMKLWHWEHPGRDVDNWQEQVDQSYVYMQQKWNVGTDIWLSRVLPPLHSLRAQREELWKVVRERGDNVEPI